VIRDIEKGEAVLGAPAIPIKEFHYMMAFLRRLAAKKRGE